MANRFEQFISGSMGIARRGAYIADHATPMFCTELLMRNIANNIQDLTEAQPDESAKEASNRFKLARDYVRVLDYLMGVIERDITPALEKLHRLQFPEETEDEAT